MSDLGVYSFLPWLRHGIANQITAADFDAAVKLRATARVALELRGKKLDGGAATLPVERQVELFGPGDIVGIEQRAIVRTEPRHWMTNFEPNYLAHIEFYDEDFPWRYTPAAPDLARGRLRPWITLLVLSEDEFTDGRNMKERPLPYIELANLTPFPRADELWAWAHVHVNRSLAAGDAEFVSSNMAAVLPKLQQALAENADLGYSRLISPRKLAENTAYHAFVIPSFETGRRAGLGLALDDVASTLSAWDPGTRPEGQNFPYYFRWFFRTGASGDFESLVRLLKPREVDRRVGTREMDVLRPSPIVSGVDKPELGGILKLGGALRPPTPSPAPPPDKYETWDQPFPRPLEQDLARLLNLPDDYERSGDPDPIIAPPLYGRWHALVSRVLKQADGTPAPNQDNWVHRLNLDPRFRAAAGIATRVIQDQQEKLMDAAWEQVGKVLEAQRRVRLGQFGLQTSRVWYVRHLAPLAAVSRQKALWLLAPLNKRLLNAGSTIHHTLGQAFVQPAMTSPALRRMLRPRGRILRKTPFTPGVSADALLQRVNRGDVSAATPKVAPPGVLTKEQIIGRLLPPGTSEWILDWLRRVPAAPAILFLFLLALSILAIVLLPAPLGFVVAAGLLGLGVWIHRRLTAWKTAAREADALADEAETPEAVDAMPAAPGFVVTQPGEAVPAGRGPDSPEAVRLKAALREHFEGLSKSRAAGVVPAKRSLDLDQVLQSAMTTLDPNQTIPKRVLASIFIPPRIREQMGEAFVEPMAYPVIDLPMYEPLKDRSAELFLPNINLIEMNSITLLETNQRFIEAYMVGLNHEFARELLWREYPTDQRGSSFRQFWDVKSFFNADNLDDDALKEKLRDIPPLHRWSLTSELGDHDHRETGGENEAELVLVIRGELLKRYPNAVIYAHRACWQKRSDGSPAELAKEPCLRSGALDNTQERRLAPLTPGEEKKPPTSKVRTPLYEAKVDPDIYFFGFDLSVAEAKGGTGESATDDPGWFFVIKERPGEPRFGLDAEAQTTIHVWNDLSWPDVQPGPPGTKIEIASAPAAFPLNAPGTEEQEKLVQYEDDRKVTWSHDMSSAELAYILFQAPVLVGVHASEMLP